MPSKVTGMTSSGGLAAGGSMVELEAVFLFTFECFFLFLLVIVFDW